MGNRKQGTLHFFSILLFLVLLRFKSIVTTATLKVGFKSLIVFVVVVKEQANIRNGHII